MGLKSEGHAGSCLEGAEGGKVGVSGVEVSGVSGGGGRKACRGGAGSGAGRVAVDATLTSRVGNWTFSNPPLRALSLIRSKRCGLDVILGGKCVPVRSCSDNIDLGASQNVVLLST